MLLTEPSRPFSYRRAPVRHLTELNPQGKLRENLLMATLFEPGNWQRDYVNPGMTFTITNQPAFGDASIGGGWVSPGINGIITLDPAPQLASPYSWTLSMGVFFTGAVQPTTTYSLLDGTGLSYFVIQGADGFAPGQLTLPNGNVIGSWSAADYTGWHRITVTAPSDATGIFYFDGILQGSSSIASAGQPVSILGQGTTRTTIVPTQFSDIFFWNATLSPQQVAEHVADPYGTVLRPRFSRLGRVASAAAGARRKPSLMTTGVGP